MLTSLGHDITITPHLAENIIRFFEEKCLYHGVKHFCIERARPFLVPDITREAPKRLTMLSGNNIYV
jgi:hypothetical protein